MKTFFQLREETTGKTLKVSQDIYEAAQELMMENTYGTYVHPETHDYEHPDVVKHAEARFNHVDKAHMHARKKGYKINYHNDHNDQPMAGHKQHKKPDVTVYHNEYDGVDTRIKVHPKGAAAHDPVINKPEHHIRHDRKMNKHMYDE